MNRKLIISIIMIIIVILVIVDIHLLLDKHSNNKKPVSSIEAYSISQYVSSGVAYGNNTMVFSNNNALVAYNYVSGKPTDLSPASSENYLINLDSLSVSDNRQFIVFHQTQTVVGGPLYSILSNEGIPPTTPFGYWWLYNVSSQQFTPLPQTTILAKLSGNNLYVLGSSNSGEFIATYQDLGLQQISTINIVGSSNFFVAKGGFVLQEPNNSVVFTSNGLVNNTILNSTNVIGLIDNQTNVIGIQKQNGVNRLIDFNLTSDTLKVIAPQVGAQAATNAESVLYFNRVTNKSAYYVYNATTNKNAQWKLPNYLLGTNSQPLTLLNGPTAIISLGQATNYLVGSNINSVVSSF